MDRDEDGETSYKYNTFVDDVALEPTYLQALPTAAGRNVATFIVFETLRIKFHTRRVKLTTYNNAIHEVLMEFDTLKFR